MKYSYCELVIGGVQNRNTVVNCESVQMPVGRTDCYRSVFDFDEDFSFWVNRTGSVKAYAGKHTAHALPFDFDCKDNLRAVQEETIKFCMYLDAHFGIDPNCLRIYYSGCKGFHVFLPIELFGAITPRYNFSQIAAGIVDDIAGTFTYMDDSIYSTTSLLRLPNTKNSKSGLFKIPLSYIELKSLDTEAIRKLAASPRLDFVFPAYECKELPTLVDLYQKWSKHDFTVKSKVQEESTERRSPKANFEELLRGVSDGARNRSAMQLCGTLIQRGMKEFEAEAILRMWNKHNEPPMSEQELIGVVEKAYARYADVSKGDLSEDIYSIQEAVEKYWQYSQRISERKVMTGYPILDSKLRGIAPGEVLVVQGKAGGGKSAGAQNFAHNYAKATGQPVLFFSMEMPIVSVVERAIQIELELQGATVEQSFIESTDGIPELAKMIFSKLPNLYTIEKSGLTIDKIRQYIEFAEQSIYQKKTGLVVIDYLGLVQGVGNNLYERVSSAARSIKDLAKQLDVPIIFLTQINKSKADNERPDINSSRDSGSIAEAADFMLSIWQDDEREVKSPEMVNVTITITKNRKGGKGDVPFMMNRKTMRFSEDSEPVLKKKPNALQTDPLSIGTSQPSLN
ncbi:MAG: AAA family ATPase [Bacteroidetes bacterium]|nr:AAA family ATPase [Bacteroidota bacterium]